MQVGCDARRAAVQMARLHVPSELRLDMRQYTVYANPRQYIPDTA